MRAPDAVRKPPVTIAPEGSIAEAACLMDKNVVGALVVMEGGARPVGVVTDRDVVLRGVSFGLRPAMTTVRQVMTKKVLYVYDDQSLTDASLVMEKNFVHRLLVHDRQERLVGIVSLSDIAARSKEERLCGHVLGKVVAA